MALRENPEIIDNVFQALGRSWERDVLRALGEEELEASEIERRVNSGEVSSAENEILSSREVEEALEYLTGSWRRPWESSGTGYIVRSDGTGYSTRNAARVGLPGMTMEVVEKYRADLYTEEIDEVLGALGQLCPRYVAETVYHRETECLLVFMTEGLATEMERVQGRSYGVFDMQRLAGDVEMSAENLLKPLGLVELDPENGKMYPGSPDEKIGDFASDLLDLAYPDQEKY